MKTISKIRTKLSSSMGALIHDTAMLPGKAHAAVFTVAMFASSHVMAAGVTGFLSGWKSAITTGIDLALLAGMGIGICAVLYGLINLIKKGMGRGDDIEWGKILWPIIGGALCTITLYVVQAVVEEGGASRSDMGRSR